MNHDRLTALLEDRADDVMLRAGSLHAVRRRARHRQARQRVAVGAAGVAVIGGVAAGVAVSGDDSTARVGPAETAASNSGGVDPDVTMPVSTGPQVVIATDPDTPKTQLGDSLRRGSFGDGVKAMQQRLHDLGFDPGPVDGQFGTGTEQALWAFEKLVLGTPSADATGVLTDDMWRTMQDPIVIQPRRAEGAGYTHVEIYLDLQVAIVFTDDSPTLITHISSGSGETWCEVVTYDTDFEGQVLEAPIEKDVCGVAKTPGGVFEFYRRYEGSRQGPLGGMWNPVYFNFGIAIHGAKNVPVMPVSHGGVRIPMFIADYFPTLVSNGDNVYVWDGEKEPEEQSENDMLPIFDYPNPDSTEG